MTRRDALPLAASLASTRVLDLVPRCSLLVPLALMDRWVAVAAAVPVALAVLSPRAYRHPVVWFGYAAVFAVPKILDWHGVDNHHYLVGYWLLALGCALCTADPARSLATAGRLLVGLVFGFAATWKFTSGQVLGGDFFHFSLLVDPRLEAVGRWGASIGPETQAANLAAWSALTQPDSTLTSIQFVDTPRAQPIAMVMTWWGTWFEASVAAAFLLPARRGAIQLARAGTLLAFTVTTYLVIPVTTFGATLMLMAYAQADPAGRTRLAYLGGLAFMVVYAPLWEWIVAHA